MEIIFASFPILISVIIVDCDYKSDDWKIYYYWVIKNVDIKLKELLALKKQMMVKPSKVIVFD